MSNNIIYLDNYKYFSSYFDLIPTGCSLTVSPFFRLDRLSFVSIAFLPSRSPFSHLDRLSPISIAFLPSRSPFSHLDRLSPISIEAQNAQKIIQKILLRYLTVCFLVVGFPAGFVLVSIGVLMAVLLHAVMPISSVILVGTGILVLNILIVVASAALLTIKGIKPQEVTWLSWLHGDAELHYDRVYASCPLTCELAEG